MLKHASWYCCCWRYCDTTLLRSAWRCCQSVIGRCTALLPESRRYYRGNGVVAYLQVGAARAHLRALDAAAGRAVPHPAHGPADGRPAGQGLAPRCVSVPPRMRVTSCAMNGLCVICRVLHKQTKLSRRRSIPQECQAQKKTLEIEGIQIPLSVRLCVNAEPGSRTFWCRRSIGQAVCWAVNRGANLLQYDLEETISLDKTHKPLSDDSKHAGFL